MSRKAQSIDTVTRYARICHNTNMRKQSRNDSQRRSATSNRYENKKRKESDVILGDSKKKSVPSTRHRDEKSVRSSTRKHRTSSSITPGTSEKNEFDDAQLFCDDCNEFYENICPYHRQPYIPDRKISKSSVHRKAELTCPDGIIIKTSALPKAGKGVFATKRIEKHTFFGPYLGTRHSDFKSAQQSGYAWSISDKFGEMIYLIDGCDSSNSNWMRFINCPNTIHQQNVQPVQYDRNMFYKTTRMIHPGEELLVYYGDEYARYLGVTPFDTDNDNHK